MNVLPLISVIWLSCSLLQAVDDKADQKLRWGISRSEQNYNLKLYEEHNELVRQIHEGSNLYINRENNQLLLRGKNCPRLLQELRRIRRWTLSVNPKHEFPEFPSDCPSDLSGKFFLSVDKWLLPVVASNVDRVYPFYGPNCLNTTLRALGVTQAPRYTGQAAFCEQIELYCSPILKKEDLRPGDIISIGFHDRSPGLTSPLHSFTWISEDLVYEKGGSDIIFPGRFVPAASIWQARAVSPECVLPSIPAPKTCEHYARAYRCRNERIKTKTSTEIDKRTLELTEMAEAEIEKFTKLDAMPTIDLLRSILSTLEYQANLIDAQLPKFDKTLPPSWERSVKLTPEDNHKLLSTRLYELKREFSAYIENLESRALYKRLSVMNVEALLNDFQLSRLDYKYETAWRLALAQLLVDRPQEHFAFIKFYLKDNETDPALERLLRNALFKARTFRPELTTLFGDYPRKD